MQADQLKINANTVQALCFGVTSGWDFSSRWFVNVRTKSISNIDIITILGPEVENIPRS